MIIELRLCPGQGPQINRLPVGRVFGEGQAPPWPRDCSESSVGSRGVGWWACRDVASWLLREVRRKPAEAAEGGALTTWGQGL